MARIYGWDEPRENSAAALTFAPKLERKMKGGGGGWLINVVERELIRDDE